MQGRYSCECKIAQQQKNDLQRFFSSTSICVCVCQTQGRHSYECEISQQQSFTMVLLWNCSTTMIFNGSFLQCSFSSMFVNVSNKTEILLV